MFSNGTEYEYFLSENCEKCPFYVSFEEEAPEKPVCQIEEDIAIGGVTKFPKEWLDTIGTSGVYSCRKRLGLDKKY